MWILREIASAGGEVGFRRFMELALYHPEHGFYSGASTAFGREGDFLTAPTVSGWYGAVVGGLFATLAEARSQPLELVDLAAGDGSFLASVLGHLSATHRPPPGRVIAVERSAARRRQIASSAAGRGVEIEVVAELAPLHPPAVVHASELYDAMPVHRVEATAEGLVEHTVVIDGDRLEWGRRPAGENLVGYLSIHGVELERGQIAEINLEAEPWHRRVLETAGEGLALILDYGYPARRLYDPRARRGGSLATYRRHELGRDPLDSPGERDLTAHVNWDDLRRAADSTGWFEIGLMPLAELLVRAGIGELADERGFGIEAELDAATYAARQEVKQLLDPEGMGSDLKVLVQGKGEVGEIAAEILNRQL